MAAKPPPLRTFPALQKPGPPQPAYVARHAVPSSSIQRHGVTASRTVQRYVWGVIDDEDENNQIVEGNLTRFNAKRKLPLSTDKNITEKTLDQVSSISGPLHLHGHGHEGGFALMKPSTFAAKTKEKFGVSALRNRTIVFHSCEVGKTTFLKDFLTALIGEDAKSKWSGALVFGPTRFLGVNHDGISQVSRPGVTESQMSGVSDYFHGLMERKGREWRVALVQGGSVIQKDVVVGSSEYVILKNALSLS
ncbi:MAG: hypothetical protein HYU59_13975 [Magnetospirillum gryphiswaldense]|nr:hypothetical protein [Magnetospirillum gryphiswaldense]